MAPQSTPISRAISKDQKKRSSREEQVSDIGNQVACPWNGRCWKDMSCGTDSICHTCTRSQWIWGALLHYWLSYQDKLKNCLRYLTAVFHQPLISQVDICNFIPILEAFFKVWIHDITVRIRVGMFSMSMSLIFKKHFITEYLKHIQHEREQYIWLLNNERVRGADPHRSRKSAYEFWLPQNLTSSLLLTGSFMNNKQAN